MNTLFKKHPILAGCLVAGLVMFCTAATVVERTEFRNLVKFFSDVNVKENSTLTVESGSTLSVAGTTTLSGTTTIASPTFATPSATTSLTLTGAEAGDATFNIYADEGDDIADQFKLVAIAATNRLEIKAGGTNIVVITPAGVVTIRGGLTVTSGAASVGGTNLLAVTSAMITDGTIANADISDSAGIVSNKIASVAVGKIADAASLAKTFLSTFAIADRTGTNWYKMVVGGTNVWIVAAP